MKWRIIVNLSLADDSRRGAGLGNAIKKCLKECGIKAVEKNSHSWEGKSVSPKDAAVQLKKVIDYLANPKEHNYGAELDAMTIYIDRSQEIS